MKSSNYLQSRVCFKNTQSPTCTPTFLLTTPSSHLFVIFRGAGSREDGFWHPVRWRCSPAASLPSACSAAGCPGVWLLVDLPRNMEVHGERQQAVSYVDHKMTVVHMSTAARLSVWRDLTFSSWLRQTILCHSRLSSSSSCHSFCDFPVLVWIHSQNIYRFFQRASFQSCQNTFFATSLNLV